MVALKKTREWKEKWLSILNKLLHHRIHMFYWDIRKRERGRLADRPPTVNRHRHKFWSGSNEIIRHKTWICRCSVINLPVWPYKEGLLLLVKRLLLQWCELIFSLSSLFADGNLPGLPSGHPRAAAAAWETIISATLFCSSSAIRWTWP